MSAPLPLLPGFKQALLCVFTLAGLVAGPLSARSSPVPSTPAQGERGEAAPPTLRELPISLGPRPAYLVEAMAPGPLQEALRRCATAPPRRSRFSIAHRGAPLQFPEHSREGYLAAAQMGAGVLECDVTFTRDQELVCRHSECDLHQTTDILLRPALAAKCSEPFQPADPETGREARARCCTSDLNLSEFKRLCARMDQHDPSAVTPEAYLGGGTPWRTQLYRGRCGTVMSHRESITLARGLGLAMTPELKRPARPLPEGFSRRQLSERFISAYREAEVPLTDLYPQSFERKEIARWRALDPAFAARAVYLEGRVPSRRLLPRQRLLLLPLLLPLRRAGIERLAAPLWMLAEASAEGALRVSPYGALAAELGFELIAWTLERSPPRSRRGRDWYYQGLEEVLTRDGDLFTLLHLLRHELPLIGVFSDWPATVSYYASCPALFEKPAPPQPPQRP